MSAAETLRKLIGGDRAATVLGACRLESGGVDAFGSEAVLDVFRRAPVGDGAIVASLTSVALFPDLYGDHIGRLWRVGQPDPGNTKSAVGVAFDPDLAQARVAVAFAASDHPEPAADAAACLDAAGWTIIEDPACYRARARAFVVRAFSDAHSGAALFAVHGLAAPPVRTPALTMAAARWDGDAVQIVQNAHTPRTVHVRIVG